MKYIFVSNALGTFSFCFCHFFNIFFHLVLSYNHEYFHVFIVFLTATAKKKSHFTALLANPVQTQLKPDQLEKAKVQKIILNSIKNAGV